MANVNGDTIKNGLRRANTDFQGVQTLLNDVADGAKFKGLDGEDRKNFFRNLDDNQFAQLNKVASSLGVEGLSALELILSEVEDMDL